MAEPPRESKLAVEVTSLAAAHPRLRSSESAGIHTCIWRAAIAPACSISCASTDQVPTITSRDGSLVVVRVTRPRRRQDDSGLHSFAMRPEGQGGAPLRG